MRTNWTFLFRLDSIFFIQKFVVRKIDDMILRKFTASVKLAAVRKLFLGDPLVQAPITLNQQRTYEKRQEKFSSAGEANMDNTNGIELSQLAEIKIFCICFSTDDRFSASLKSNWLCPGNTFP